MMAGDGSQLFVRGPILFENFYPDSVFLFLYSGTFPW